MKKSGSGHVPAIAASLMVVFGIYAYIENRDEVNISGTIDQITLTATSDGNVVDHRQPIRLENVMRLAFHDRFNEQVQAGVCYDFTLVNTVSAQLEGVSGEIIAAAPSSTPCLQAG
jgi:hypothetical protein